MSSKTKVRTLRLPKDLDDYIGRVSADTGKSLTEVLTEGVLMHRAGGAAGLGSSGSSSKIEAKLDVVLEVMKLQADQLNLLNSKVEGIERQAPIIDSTHRYVAGLNKSVGVMFRNVETLLRELGFEPVTRKAGDKGGDRVGDDDGDAGEYGSPHAAETSAKTEALGQGGSQAAAPAPSSEPPLTLTKEQQEWLDRQERRADGTIVLSIFPPSMSAPAPAAAKAAAVRQAPTLSAEQLVWLEENGKQLAVPYESFGFISSDDEFEARLRLLEEGGAHLPRVPGGIVGVSAITRYLNHLLTNDGARLDEILGCQASRQIFEAHERRQRAMTPPVKAKRAKGNGAGASGAKSRLLLKKARQPA